MNLLEISRFLAKSKDKEIWTPNIIKQAIRECEEELRGVEARILEDLANTECEISNGHQELVYQHQHAIEENCHCKRDTQLYDAIKSIQ